MSAVLTTPASAPRARARPGPGAWLAALALALILLMIIATGTGAYRIAPLDVIAILFNSVGLEFGSATPQQELVLHTIRLPRVLLAVCVGSGLAAAGALMQGLFRNPLADPGLIGVSSGAALAAAFVIVLGATVVPGLSKALGLFTLPVAAFGGGLATAWLIYRIAQNGNGTALAVMLLAGIAINSLAGAGLGLLTYMANDDQLRTLTFWSMGSLGGAGWNTLAVSAPAVVLVLAASWRLARPLNALLLGEAEAGHLGVNVKVLKRWVIVLAALASGVLVAVAGIIGFIGLVAPHLARLMFGPDHRLVLPASALIGAILVLTADLAARMLAIPAELPLGIFTAILGAPFFLALLLRERGLWSA